MNALCFYYSARTNLYKSPKYTNIHLVGAFETEILCNIFKYLHFQPNARSLQRRLPKKLSMN